MILLMDKTYKGADSPVQAGQPAGLAFRLRYRKTFLIGIGFMTTSIAWAYYNFQIPLILYSFLGEGAAAQVLVGFLMTLDNIIAVPVQPFFGALSDRMESRMGRRMPFIIIGIIGAAIFFIIAPFMGAFAPFLGVIICFNVMMALYRAPVVALMPDMTPAPVRSKGNAAINLMGGVGFILGYGSGMLGRTYGFIAVSIMMLVSLVILFFTIRETPTGKGLFHVGKDVISIDPITQVITPREVIQKEDAGHSKSKLGDLKDIIREKDKSGLWMLLAIFMLIFGFNAIETFYSKLVSEMYLANEAWLASHSGLIGDALTLAAEKSAAGVLLLLPVMYIIAAIPGGILGERIGRRLTIKIGLVMILAGVLTVWILPISLINISLVLVYIAAVGYGLATVNTIVVIWQMAPMGRIGSYTGVYYFFSILAAIASPTLMGGIFGLATIVGLTNLAIYMTIFPYITVSIILAFLFMTRVKRGEARMTKEEVAALRLKYEEDD